MIAIDDLAYRSKLAKVDPKGKLWFSLLPLAVCIASKSMLVSICTLFVMSAASLYYGAAGIRRYLHLLMVPGVFLLLGTLTIIVGRIPAGAEMLLGFEAGGAARGDGGVASAGRQAHSTCAGGYQLYVFPRSQHPYERIVRRAGKKPSSEGNRVFDGAYLPVCFCHLGGSRRHASSPAVAAGLPKFQNSDDVHRNAGGDTVHSGLSTVDRAQAALESRGCRGGCLDTLTEKYRPCKEFYWAAGSFAVGLAGLEIICRLFF